MSGRAGTYIAMPRHIRVLALATCLVLLVAAGACRRGKPKTTEEPTLEPEPTPAVESIGDFQLVGSVQQAFLTIDPGVELPSDSGTPPEQGAEQGTPEVNGVMRVTLEAFSDNLGEKCGADKDDRFNVFWTRASLFDSSLLDGDLEQELEDRRVGVVGNIFLKPLASEGGTGEDEFGFDTPAPAPTDQTSPTPAAQTGPGATDQEGETNCILVGEQVGISTGALPSPLPTSAARRTASPCPTTARSSTRSGLPIDLLPRQSLQQEPPTASPTPTPEPTASPTPTPSPTKKPTPSPSKKPTPTPTRTPC